MTSAEIAKDRLLWCAQAQKAGGYWAECRYAQYAYWLLESPEPLTVPGRVVAYRWVYA